MTRLRDITRDDFSTDLDSIPYPGHPRYSPPSEHPGRPGRKERIAALMSTRTKSTQGNTIAPGDLDAMRARVAAAKNTLRDIATEFDEVDDTLRSLGTVPPHPDDVDDQGITTAAALEQAGAPPSAVEVARLVKQMLVDEGLIPNTNVPRARRATATERNSSALEAWMLAENTRQDMTRWLGLMINGTAQAFRLFRKHLKNGKPGERATWLVRNLAGEAWRFVKVDRDPPFGPGRPLKLTPAGDVRIHPLGAFTWREAPNSRTLLGVLYNEEKDLRYALVRAPEFDVSADDMVPADVRGAV